MKLSFLFVAISVFGGCASAPARAEAPPSLTIELSQDTANTQETKRLLFELTRAFDISQFLFTKTVHIDPMAIPHSHPVLTLNTRHNDDSDRLLSVFLHEEFHWYLDDYKKEATEAAIVELHKIYPQVPKEGVARDDYSTYLHLIVCWLELQVDKGVLGNDKAYALLAKSDVYPWIYKQIIDNEERLRPIYEKLGISEKGTGLPAVKAPPFVWRWKGFEIIGNHKIEREKLESLIPIHMGEIFSVDSPTWKVWCATIKAKFNFASADCGAVSYSNFDTYFVLDIGERGEESRNAFRPAPTRDIPLTNIEILRLYDRLYELQQSYFQRGIPPGETSENGYLDFTAPDMHEIVLRLVKLVPQTRVNLLEVLRDDKSIEKRATAANLLNWTINDLSTTVVQANNLLDDPSGLVRNNISRFTMPFVDKLQNPSDRLNVIDQLLIQLNRPSHGDRNKAIYNLLTIAQKFPQDRFYIRTKGLLLIKDISDSSILSNVRDPALELLNLKP